MNTTLETPTAVNLDGLLTQCKEQYKKNFAKKNSQDNPVFYKEPKLIDGKIQLNFANDDDAHKFFKQLQEAQDPKQPFIVTQKEKVLGYTSEGGDYWQNYPPQALDVIKEKMEKYEPFKKGQMTADELLAKEWRENMLQQLNSNPPPAQPAAPFNTTVNDPIVPKVKTGDIEEQEPTEKKITVGANTTNGEENEFLKKCQVLYKETFKNDIDKSWYEDPKDFGNGKIQLSFENDDQTEAFLKSMAKQNPGQHFIVTEGNKVLGYTSPGGEYTKNTEKLSLEECQKKMQTEYAAHNNPQSKQNLRMHPIQTPGTSDPRNPLISSPKEVTQGLSNNTNHTHTQESTNTSKSKPGF